MSALLRRLFACALLAASPAAAAEIKSFDIPGKIGASEVRISVVLHPQASACSPALLGEIRRRAESDGMAYLKAHLSAALRKAGADASGGRRFFGISYLAGCPADGSAWLAFPLQGKGKTVTRYAPGAGWSAKFRL